MQRRAEGECQCQYQLLPDCGGMPGVGGDIIQDNHITKPAPPICICLGFMQRRDEGSTSARLPLYITPTPRLWECRVVTKGLPVPGFHFIVLLLLGCGSVEAWPGGVPVPGYRYIVLLHLGCWTAEA